MSDIVRGVLLALAAAYKSAARDQLRRAQGWIARGDEGVAAIYGHMSLQQQTMEDALEGAARNYRRYPTDRRIDAPEVGSFVMVRMGMQWCTAKVVQKDDFAFVVSLPDSNYQISYTLYSMGDDWRFFDRYDQ